MEIELGQLADLLGGELTDPTQAGVKVSNVRSLDAAGPGDLAVLWDDNYRAAAKSCKASAVIAKEALAYWYCARSVHLLPRHRGAGGG